MAERERSSQYLLRCVCGAMIFLGRPEQQLAKANDCRYRQGKAGLMFR